MSAFAPPPLASDVPAEARTWAGFLHLSGFLWMLVPVPLLGILGPLLIWFWKRDLHPFVDQQGKEAINFQISMTVYTVVAALLVLIVVGIALLVGVCAAWFVLTIVAACRAFEGREWRYPYMLDVLR